MNDYIGWEPYLERGGEPDYCESDADEAEDVEELADDDDAEWAADDEQAAQHVA